MRKFGAVCAVFLAAATAAHAADAPTILLSTENDSFIANSDRHYTNGLYASWTGTAQERGDDIAGLASALMLPAGPEARWREGYFLGQTMYTPQALSLPVPPVNDRPYAGWLFAGARLYRDSGTSLDKIEATIGLVGPASLAGDLHHWWHNAGLLGGVHPRGWGYQLSNEPGVILTEQRIWRVPLSMGWLELEALPQASVSVGNIFTQAEAGGMLRLGEGLSADWGPARIAPGLAGSDFQQPESFSWYLFAGVSGRMVARNIFLDGNSFTDSRSVGHRPVVGDLNLGISFLWPQIGLSGSYVRRSEEFSGQRGDDEYLSISVSFAN